MNNLLHDRYRLLSLPTYKFWVLANLAQPFRRCLITGRNARFSQRRIVRQELGHRFCTEKYVGHAMADEASADIQTSLSRHGANMR